MLNYSVEELLEKLDKTLVALSEKQGSDSNDRTLMLMRVLSSVRDSVENKKSINVENISREIINPLDINRPKWLDELKKDDALLIKEVKSLIRAVEKKEVVREVDIKQSSWLKAALTKNKPADRDYSVVLANILKQVSKDLSFPDKMKVTGNVEIQNALSVKKPSWYTSINYTDSLKKITEILKKPLRVIVDNPVSFKDKLDVEVKNPVSVKNRVEVIIRDGDGRIIDFDKQFGRINPFTGAGGSSGVQEMKIIAEDVDNPGVFVAVQGKYNDDGHFELLTAGSGGSEPILLPSAWDSSLTTWDSSTVTWDNVS